MIDFAYKVLLRPKPLRMLANKAICSLIPAQIKVHGATVVLNLRDPVVCGALTLRVYENDEIHFFLSHFRAGMVFLDVGANVGLYTALAISREAGSVLAIEPHPETFAFLEKTVAANAPACPVITKNTAASNVRGEIPFFTNPDNKGDNRTYSDPLLRQSETVPADTLDNLCAESGIESVDFVKMDIQGAEFHALRGASQILSQSPNCLLLTEFWAYGLRQAGSDPREYLENLRGMGFHLYALVGKTLKPVCDATLVKQTSDSTYTNLVCLKGTTVQIAS